MATIVGSSSSLLVSRGEGQREIERSWRAAALVARVGEPAIAQVFGSSSSWRQRLPASRAGGHFGQGQAALPAGPAASVSLSIAALQNARRPIAVRCAAAPARHCGARRPTDAAVRATAAAVASCVRAVQRAQAVQRPQGVDGAGVQADRVDARDRWPAPSRAGTTSVLPRSTSSRWACWRQNMLSFLSVATSFSGVASLSVSAAGGLAFL